MFLVNQINGDLLVVWKNNLEPDVMKESMLRQIDEEDWRGVKLYGESEEVQRNLENLERQDNQNRASSGRKCVDPSLSRS